MKYQLYIFDFDGTIVDTHPLIKSTLKKVFKIDEKVLDTTTLSFPLRTLISKLIPNKSDEFYENAAIRYREEYSKSFKTGMNINSEVISLITQLHERGKTLIVVSNKKKSSLEEALEYMGIKKYFSIVFGEEAGKPNSLIIDRFKSAFPSTKILVVGDSQVDFEFAKNAGVDFCLANWYNSNTTELIDKSSNVANDPLDIITYDDLPRTK